MRTFLVIFFSVSILSGFSQNFVSPGIIAFHSGAYERTIQDMNKAFEVSPDMDNDMRSKAHYYRGMARLSLLKAGSNSSFIGREPYLNAYNDLTRAVLHDPKWRESATKEMNLIYSELFRSAKRSYNEGINAGLESEINTLLGSALLKLSTALKVKNSFEANDLLGKTYDAIGTYYDQIVDNQSAQNKAVSSYESAIKYYEEALKINPRSLENIRALKQLAYRLGDRAEEEKYAKMEEDLGGQ